MYETIGGGIEMIQLKNKDDIIGKTIKSACLYHDWLSLVFEDDTYMVFEALSDDIVLSNEEL